VRRIFVHYPRVVEITLLIFCCQVTWAQPDHPPKPAAKANQLVVETTNSFAKTHDRTTARNGYLKAIQIDQKCSAAWFNLGILAEADHHWLTSRNSLEKYLQLAPTGNYAGRARTELAIVSRYLQLPPDQREIAIRRDDYDADIQRSRTFLASNLYKEAISEAGRAQALDDSRWESYAVVCLVMVREGKNLEAAKYRDMALKRAPDDVKVILTNALSKRPPGPGQSPEQVKTPIATDATPAIGMALPQANSQIITSVSTRPSSAPDTNTPSLEPPATTKRTAILHVYRDSGTGGALTSDIFIDGSKVAPLLNHQIVSITLIPGRHSVSVAGSEVTVSEISGLDMFADKDYWIQMTLSVGISKAHSKLHPVPAERAQMDSAKLDEIKIASESP
jgi:Tfp pilus assembly protein PilF